MWKPHFCSELQHLQTSKPLQKRPLYRKCGTSTHPHVEPQKPLELLNVNHCQPLHLNLNIFLKKNLKTVTLDVGPLPGTFKPLCGTSIWHLETLMWDSVEPAGGTLFLVKPSLESFMRNLNLNPLCGNFVWTLHMESMSHFSNLVCGNLTVNRNLWTLMWNLYMSGTCMWNLFMRHLYLEPLFGTYFCVTFVWNLRILLWDLCLEFGISEPS